MLSWRGLADYTKLNCTLMHISYYFILFVLNVKFYLEQEVLLLHTSNLTTMYVPMLVILKPVNGICDGTNADAFRSRLRDNIT